MSTSCDELCMSISSEKLCNKIARSNLATYLVIAIAAISAVICIVLSATQVKSFLDMDWCSDYQIYQLLSPFVLIGHKSNGTQCYGYCAWSVKNSVLRFVICSIFVILMIAMIFAMTRMKYLWLIRILLFITLAVLFAALVQDSSALITGKEACDNNFDLFNYGSDDEKFHFNCDDEPMTIDDCSIEPFYYMILSDLFCVIMCGLLWQLVAYYKVNRMDDMRYKSRQSVDGINSRKKVHSVSDVDVTVSNEGGNTDHLDRY